MADLQLATIAGDIGGTNSRLALYSLNDSLLHPKQTSNLGNVLFLSRYRNAEFRSFEEVLRRFLEDAQAAVREGNGVWTAPLVAVFAVAGPVHANAMQMTNLAWPRIEGIVPIP